MFPCHILLCALSASSACLSYLETAQVDPHPRFFACRPFPNVPSPWNHHCQKPNSAPGRAARSCLSSSEDSQTSTDQTSHQGGTNSRRIHQSHGHMGGTC